MARQQHGHGNERTDMPVLVRRLRGLFDRTTYIDAAGRERRLSSQYVADSVTQDPHHDITLGRTYIDGLRNGRHLNPSLATLKALVKFFNDHRKPDTEPITVGWLAADDVQIYSPELTSPAADSETSRIALRARSLGPDDQRLVLEMLHEALAHRDTENGTQSGSESAE